MMIQVWLIGVTGRQTIRCVLNTKSCHLFLLSGTGHETKTISRTEISTVEHNGFDQGTRDHNELD